MDQTILDIIIRGKDEFSKVAKSTSSSMSGMQKVATTVAAASTAALVGFGVASVKMAGDFQQQMIRIVTTAGESQKNLQSDAKGVLAVSVATATSTEQLTQGLYTINSAGYHGAAGLTVLKAAAEGARSENAELGTVTNALTTILNDYHLRANQSVGVTNQMIAAVSAGKMNFQDFAGSLSAVLPVANAAHLSFAQVGGAVATMTAQGMSAQQATQDLANTIRALQNPNQVAINEMQQLGLDSNQVSLQLGKKGLTGTLDTLTQAITSHMGPAGTVIMDAFNKSKSAAQDANIMLSKLPASIQGVAKSYLDGSTSEAAWRLDMQMMTPLQRNLAQQFATVADKAHGFNSLLKSGSPAAQTYTAALSRITGGATGLNTALMLTGQNQQRFQQNVSSVAKAASHAGQNIDQWNLIQNSFNFRMKQAQEAIKATAIGLGTALLPPLTSVLKAIMSVLQPIVEWTTKHEKLTAIIFASLTAIAALVTGILLMHSAYTKVKASMTIAKDAMIAFKNNSLIAAIASKAMAAAQWLVNIAMDANPIGIVIVAIGALIAIAITLTGKWKAVGTFFMKLWKDIESFFRKHIGLIIGILGGPFVAIVYEVIKHWKQISGFFARLWSDVINGISSFISMVIRFFERLPGDILHAVGNFDKLLYNAGKDLIMGLVKGIKDVEHIATDTVKNVGKDVVNGFKHLLGIHSPSTVFAEAGKNIGQGLALGINSTKGLVQDATNKLVNTPNGKIAANGTVISGTVTPVTTSTPASLPASQQANQTTVNLTVNIGMYAGTQIEKQKIAVEIWQALMQHARVNNKAGNIPDLAVRPI